MFADGNKFWIEQLQLHYRANRTEGVPIRPKANRNRVMTSNYFFNY